MSPRAKVILFLFISLAATIGGCIERPSLEVTDIANDSARTVEVRYGIATAYHYNPRFTNPYDCNDGENPSDDWCTHFKKSILRDRAVPLQPGDRVSGQNLSCDQAIGLFAVAIFSDEEASFDVAHVNEEDGDCEDREFRIIVSIMREVSIR